jgi:hypothetical protein
MHVYVGRYKYLPALIDAVRNNTLKVLERLPVGMYMYIITIHAGGCSRILLPNCTLIPVTLLTYSGLCPGAAAPTSFHDSIFD